MKKRAAIALLCWALAACSGPSGHRALTFFFDGVPEPKAAGAAAVRGDGLSPAARAAQPREHGPYAAKLCDGCHESGRANALVLPADQLCGKCHALELRARYVHGPLNAGGCVLCHDPHRSGYPYLLVADSSRFCLTCHERGALRAVEGHGDGGASCAACHEAHMSERPYLLR